MDTCEKTPGQVDKQSRKRLGIGLMILSAFAFSSMQVLVSLTSRIPTMEQVFMRNFISLIVAFVWIVQRHESLFGARRYQPFLFGRSICGFGGVVFCFYGLARAGQGDVTIINKLAPFLITIAAVVFLKEKLRKLQIPALLLAMAGAFLVFQPAFHSNPLPLLAAFGSAICSAVAYTLLGYMGGKVESMTVVMHFSTLSCALAIPFVIGNFVAPTPLEALGLLGIGLLASVGQISITYAYRFAPTSEVSIFDYSMIPFSIAEGYLILGETLSPLSMLGGGLVIAAAFLGYWSSTHGEDI